MPEHRRQRWGRRNRPKDSVHISQRDTNEEDDDENLEEEETKEEGVEGKEEGNDDEEAKASVAVLRR